jgi:riboflavin synthase
MFTGIVSGLGRVVEAGGGRLWIEHRPTAERSNIGGSVAVNGVCLTVVELEGGAFRAELVPETLRRTNLGALTTGDPVNLELPVGPDGLLDGHLVQGHVDATAEVKEARAATLGREVVIELPAAVAAYVAEKGSIAVDGVSLTVANVDDEAGTFTIALIPHTLEQTVADRYKEGTRVNLEVDVVARYLERLVRSRTFPGIK